MTEGTREQGSKGASEQGSKGEGEGEGGREREREGEGEGEGEDEGEVIENKDVKPSIIVIAFIHSGRKEFEINAMIL